MRVILQLHEDSRVRTREPLRVAARGWLGTRTGANDAAARGGVRSPSNPTKEGDGVGTREHLLVAARGWLGPGTGANDAAAGGCFCSASTTHKEGADVETPAGG